MIDKLEMFIALAREEHFGKAAVAMGVTQPTLSAGIKQLEDQLGVMLVWRGSRFRGLTPEGQRTLDWARRIVADSRALRDEMRVAREGLSGNLAIAVIPTALTLVADLTEGFARTHPNVRFTVLSRTSAEILELVENLQVDAGLTVLVARPGHPLLRDGLGWADLDGVSLCLLTPDMQNRRIITQHLSEAGVTVDPRVESSSTIVLVSHVLRGDSVTILPRKAAEIFLKAGDLAAVPIVNPDAAHMVGLVAPHREPMTPVLRALLGAARSLSDKGVD
jgi:DNA-binding transcriptional LysR family regulator